MREYQPNGAIAVPTDYEQATALSGQLDAEYNRAGRALQALSGGGPMGLTPDHVRATPEWRAAKREYDAAFVALRAFNTVYVRRFKREIAQARRERRSMVYSPNEDQTWRDVYSREYGAAEGRGLQSWEAREEASRTAWRDYEARTGKPALMRNGEPFGRRYGGDVPYITGDGRRVWMHRKGQRVRWFDEAGEQVGPEQANVAPALAYAAAHGWAEQKAERMGGSHEANVSDPRDAHNEAMRRALATAGHENRPFSVRELTEHLQGRLPSNTVRYQVSRLARAGYVTLGDSGTIGITNLGWNWIEGAPRHASNASGYYVWALARGSNAPLAEGPWGPYDTLESAKTFARIGATEGAHDRAVSTGLDPQAPSFQIVRRYEAGTGERLL